MLFLLAGEPQKQLLKKTPHSTIVGAQMVSPVVSKDVKFDPKKADADGCRCGLAVAGISTSQQGLLAPRDVFDPWMHWERVQVGI